MKKSALLILTAAMLPFFAGAGSRTSASYAVSTDTIDAGGVHATSPSCTMEASVGEIGGVGNAPAPAEVIKHSYIGQLYDVKTVTVVAAPLTVNEGATRQLS